VIFQGMPPYKFVEENPEIAAFRLSLRTPAFFPVAGGVRLTQGIIDVRQDVFIPPTRKDAAARHIPRSASGAAGGRDQDYLVVDRAPPPQCST